LALERVVAVVARVAVAALPERAPINVGAVTVPDILALPRISSLAVGVAVPIPTLPTLLTTRELPRILYSSVAARIVHDAIPGSVVILAVGVHVPLLDSTV
jgi:hypothetical protein